MGAGQNEIHILITTYNGHRFIERSLGSALEQTYPRTKIIVYDDGSEDDTLGLVCRMAEAHPQREVLVVEGGVNRFTAYARQKSVEASQQWNPDAFFMWLDQDDHLTSPQTVETVMAQMDKTEADICLINFNVEWEDDSPELKANATGLMIDKKRHEELLEDIVARPTQTVSFSDCPFLLNATSLGATKIYTGAYKMKWPEIRTEYIFEDFPPMALLLNAGKVTAIAPDRPMSDFLRRSTSRTGDRHPQHFFIDFVRQMRDFLREVGTSDAARAEAAQGFVQGKAQQYEKTLRALIDIKRPGFDESVMEKYLEAVKTL